MIHFATVNKNIPRKPNAIGLNAQPLSVQREIAEKLATSSLRATKEWLASRGIVTNETSLGDFRRRMLTASLAPGSIATPVRLQFRVVEFADGAGIVELGPPVDAVPGS